MDVTNKKTTVTKNRLFEHLRTAIETNKTVAKLFLSKFVSANS